MPNPSVLRWISCTRFSISIIALLRRKPLDATTASGRKLPCPLPLINIPNPLPSLVQVRFRPEADLHRPIK